MRILLHVMVMLTLMGSSVYGYAEPTQGFDGLPFNNLMSELRKGGYVVYVRHGQTDRTKGDEPINDLERCDTQRQLDNEGRHQMQVIGSVIKSYAIPVGEVYSSPFCRCTESAELALGHYQIHHQLYYANHATQEERQENTQALRRLLSTKPAQGNTFIVGHSSNLKEAANIWPKPESVVYVFKPLGGENGYQVIGRVLPDEWKIAE